MHDERASRNAPQSAARHARCRRDRVRHDGVRVFHPRPDGGTASDRGRFRIARRRAQRRRDRNHQGAGRGFARPRHRADGAGAGLSLPPDRAGSRRRAMGIMVPMVETPEQARQIASWCRYPPTGVRGSAFGMAHDDYAAGDVVAKMRIANERTLVIALVETARGIENIDAIMAVDGIDIGWLGHFDLTASMGIPGQFEHPDFLRAVEALVAACRAQSQAGRVSRRLGRNGAGVAGKGVPRDRLQHRYRPVAGFAARRAGEAACRRGVTRSRGDRVGLSLRAKRSNLVGTRRSVDGTRLLRRCTPRNDRTKQSRSG